MLACYCLAYIFSLAVAPVDVFLTASVVANPRLLLTRDYGEDASKARRTARRLLCF